MVSQDSRRTAGQMFKSPSFPQYILFNGKSPYNNSWGGRHESFTLKKGNLYKKKKEKKKFSFIFSSFFLYVYKIHTYGPQ